MNVTFERVDFHKELERIKMDIETMRGEIIEHKAAMQVMKTAISDLQVRLTVLENRLDTKVVNQEPSSKK